MQQTPPVKKRLYDWVVWGASGFVGRLVVEYLVGKYPPGSGFRWAVAGRDRRKLEDLLNRYPSAGEQPSIVLAESHDRASLDQLVRDTKVVLSTVGPYAKHGSELVEACVASGTDYCDLCGEVPWMRKMIDQHQPEAQKSGARIVMSCGFDSIPSDLGVFFLQEQAKSAYGQPCSEIALLVRAVKGGFSGGTVASLLNVVDQARRDRDVARVLMDPYGLNPEGQRDGPERRDPTGAQFNVDAGTWTAPFVMASVNTRVVRRTNALLGYPYGRDFLYSEATMGGKGVRGRWRSSWMSAGLRVFVIASSIPFTRRWIVEKLAPKPGDGPTRQQRESGYFNLLLIGKASDGDTMRVRVKGDRDPGYGSTSKMIAETAVCLAKDELETGGGFWTPASALGTVLLERLIANAGLSFELE